MRVEVWSPDGIEAAASGHLFEVLMGENEPLLGLVDEPKGCRVWLDEGDVRFLREMLSKTGFGAPAPAEKETR
jgi:hypothetical protein